MHRGGGGRRRQGRAAAQSSWLLPGGGGSAGQDKGLGAGAGSHKASHRDDGAPHVSVEGINGGAGGEIMCV